VSVKVDRETGNAGSVLTVAGFDVQVKSALFCCFRRSPKTLAHLYRETASVLLPSLLPVCNMLAF